MKVKISTEMVLEGERIGAGSVIEVPAEVFKFNDSWMEPTDDKLKKLPPAEEKPSKNEK